MSGNLLATLYDGKPADAAFRLDDRVLTRADMLDVIARWAAVLNARGIKRGDRVSFKLDKTVDVVVLAHACLQLGAILHPMNTGYTDREIGELVHDVEPSLFVCAARETDRYAELAASVDAAIETIDALASAARAAAPRHERAVLAGDATAALLYTSGTTGRPKGAEITHRNLAESARALAEIWRIGPRDTLVHCLPLYHAHGLLTSIDVTLAGGGSVRLLPTFEAGDVAAAFESATVFMGVPTHYARLLASPSLTREAAAGMRLFISGSAPLQRPISDAFRERTGHVVLERYGATETAIVTALPAGTADRTGWVGWALPGVDVRVASGGDRGIGDLETRGHNVFRGYWRRPDATREASTTDGWFKTGDIAEIDDGGCVRLLGRSKDIVISGGLNVYPLEVEAVLDAIDGVAEAAVFGVPHPDYGEAVVALVTMRTNAHFDASSILTAARLSLAPFKVPKRLIAVADIPRNFVGKVAKRDLRARYGDLFSNPGE